jgi:FlaA1/EpsC-like NDP-sugar epimerase
MEKRPLHSESLFGSELFQRVCGRDEVELIGKAQIKEIFGRKRVLVTGAGGTIGSAVVRRLIDSGLEDVTFLDRDESALHALALSVSDKAASHSEKCVVADIKDKKGLSEVFDAHRPDIVIHAAALKHLVILERFPREGFLTNISGTMNLIEVSRDYGVSHFTNVSTDKAANPTSFLGITKRITEIITASLSNDFMTTSSVRFGNVFASRGSVIETFIHQIENDLPVTITDVEVERFFMSHREAANLVLTATSLIKDSLYIQDMGAPVRILDVIQAIAGILGKEFSIKQIGLQDGEKISEELFDSAPLPTIFPTIFEVKPPVVTDIHQALSCKLAPSTNSEAYNSAKEIMFDLNSQLFG